MPKLFRRLYRHTKRHIKQGLRDQRTFNLYWVACRLLAKHDHEQISVAQIARETGISVGAFYQRFSNKEAFLGMVVSERMRSAGDHLGRKLDPARWRDSVSGAVVQAIVEEMMRSLHGPGAGVVRTALKRGHLDRAKLEPLVRYRAALADSAVALLAHRTAVCKPERAVRSAMQIATATALDTLLHDAGTLRPGSQHMADALSVMMLGMLELSSDQPAHTQAEAEAPAAPAEDDDTEAMLAMPIEEAVAIPIPEAASVRTVRRPRREPRTEPVGKIPTVKPTSVQQPQRDDKPEPLRQGRHRPKF